MRLNKHIKIASVLLFPIIVFGLILLFSWKPSINLISDKNFSVLGFTDAVDKGNSTCEFKNTGTQINTTYFLKTGYTYPYAGLLFQPKNLDLMNLEDYTVVLSFLSEQNCRISIRFNQYLDGYTDTVKPLTFLMLVKPLSINKGENHFVFQTQDINEIPDWWFRQNPSRVNKINNVSLSKARDIWFFSDYSTELNIPISFTVKEFRLTYNYQPILNWALIISSLYYITFLILWIFKKEKIRYIFLPIELTQISDKVPRLQADILTYIGANYANPDLKLADVSAHVGLAQDTTSEILKKYCNKNFRQYLNQIRMEEAKRLLKETTLQIAEIGYKVGYNNIQHFNRVFKEYTNESPSSFREQ